MASLDEMVERLREEGPMVTFDRLRRRLDELAEKVDGVDLNWSGLCAIGGLQESVKYWGDCLTRELPPATRGSRRRRGHGPARSERSDNVIDLMDALKRSLAHHKGEPA